MIYRKFFRTGPEFLNRRVEVPHVSFHVDAIGKFNQFTGFTVKARLTVPPGTNRAKAETILEKAEKYCLVTNSLKAKPQLETEVVVA